MTEPSPTYKTNGRMQTYQLTSTEAKYLRRLHQMQNAADTQQVPRVLTVFFDGRTVSFFDGHASGIERGER